MAKKACKKEDYEDKSDAKFICKKCGAKVKKKDKACKPKKIKKLLFQSQSQQ